ncbi:MAG: hypothetical protein J6Y42_00780 [Bacilli bacterium]|nr:hypothetical protein [Bacilli bacterium]
MKKLMIVFLLLLSLFIFACKQTNNTNKNNNKGSDSFVNFNDLLGDNYMYARIDDKEIKIKLEDNSSTKSLLELLEEGNIVFKADDYQNFEKVGDIGTAITKNDSEVDAKCFDVLLYNGRNITFIYGTNSYSYTVLGKVEGISEAEYKEFLKAGNGEVSITLSKTSKNK